VCGVGDHTSLLAEALGQRGLDVAFVYCGWQQAEKPALPGQIARWNGRPGDLCRCVERQEPDWFWLQLSGYGFSRWGAPYALGQSLRRLRRAIPAVRVATYAHELYCEPHQLGWKGSLLSSWQKRTVGRILRQSDVVFASNTQYRERVITQFELPGEHVHILPIGSNVAIPSMTPEQTAGLAAELGWSPGERVAAIFGSFALQERGLDCFADILRQGFREGTLQRVVAIGGQPGPIPNALREKAKAFGAHGPVQVLGHQPGPRIGAILQICDFGLLPYPRHLLRKSTVFIAYACAGLAVLSLDDVGNKMTRPDELPILKAEEWHWAQAGSPRVQALRQSLRSYAEEHWTWPSIAARALECLHSRSAPAQLRAPALSSAH
jgi:hypothetical protein